jgi:Tfp pilus assembly protein PilZ
MKNVRHNARHRVRLRVTLAHTSSFTVDVCAGGFCTESMRMLRPGSEVEGSIRVNGREVTFGGQVAWVKPSELDSKSHGRMGVRFTRVPWDLQRLLDFPPAGGVLLPYTTPE